MIPENFFSERLERVNMHNVLNKAIEENEDEIIQLNRDQLWDGKDATGKDISPSYLEDPYFKTKEQAIAYMNWKWKITPNPERKKEVPNMYINGLFYKSLETEFKAEEFKIKTNSSLGREIDAKFDNLEGLTEKSINTTGEFIKDDVQQLYAEEVMR